MSKYTRQHWRRFGRIEHPKYGRIDFYLVDFRRPTVVVYFKNNHENPGEWWPEFNELAEEVFNEYQNMYGDVFHTKVMYAYNDNDNNK